MKIIVSLIGIAAFFLAVGCAKESNADKKGKSSGSSAGEVVAELKVPSTAPDISGAKWKLKSWSEKNIDPSKFEITAEFKDGRVSGKSAVNRYGGPFKANADGSFSVGDFSLTAMKGPGDAMKAESLYHEIFRNVRKHAVDSKNLILSDEKGNVLLVFEKE